MSESLTDQLIKKLGLQNEPGISNKTTELIRLLDLKSSKIVGCVGDYAKTVICIDLAASSLGIPFEYIDGLKQSGLRRTVYQNYKRTFEKLLDLSRTVNINDICLQLGLNDVSKRANELYKIYQESVGGIHTDLSHPQYAAMAVFQACKELKHRIPKQKFLPYSHLKSTQWTKLEQQWLAVLKLDANLRTITKKDFTKNESIPGKGPKANVEINKKYNKLQIVDDYEVWRNNWIKTALKDYQGTSLPKRSSNYQEIDCSNSEAILNYLSSDSDDDFNSNIINTYL